MKWSTPLEGWMRREALFASLWGAVTAASVVAAAAGLAPAWLPLLVVPGAGAGLKLAIVARRNQLERRREKAALDRRVRTKMARVAEVRLTQIGVDPAAQDVLPGGEVPAYVPRRIDGEVRQALLDAVSGRGPWIVAVSGPSKVGKSRTLFEALRYCEEQTDSLYLVAPADGDALRSLLETGIPDRRRGHLVVWLDDIEAFAADGVGFDTLREWHEGLGAIFAITYGGKGSERAHRLDAPELAFLTSEILARSREVGLNATDPEELVRLPRSVSVPDRATIEEYGLAAAMVAAPALQRKLTTRRHTAGDPESFEGEAVVAAAVDWARCGRADAIPEERLRQLWESYLGQSARPSDQAFEEGLAWALKPVAGRIALLTHSGGLRPYDYVVRYVSDQGGVPRAEAWQGALHEAPAHQAFSVGLRAYQERLKPHALSGFTVASQSHDPELAELAAYNLGVTHWQAGETQQAEKAYRRAGEMGSADGVAGLGVLLAQRGELEAAEAAYRQADSMGHGGGASNLGQMLKQRGDLDEAEAAYCRALDHGYGGGGVNLGLLRVERDDPAGAEDAFRQAADLGVGEGMVGVGLMALARGGREEAKTEFARALGMDTAVAALPLGQLLSDDGDVEGAKASYRRGAELGEAAAALRLGELLLREEDFDGARRAFEEAAGSNDEAVVEAAVVALAALLGDGNPDAS